MNEVLEYDVSLRVKELQSRINKSIGSFNRFEKNAVASTEKIRAATIKLQDPLKKLGDVAIKVATIVGTLKLGQSFSQAGIDIEASEKKMAGLINTTTQFLDVSGNAVDPFENLNRSLGQSRKLLQRFREDAAGLAGVTTTQLVEASQFTLPKLGALGITDADEQADLIETITASLNNLGLAYNEVQLRQEALALLDGKAKDLRATFANLVGKVNGGADAWEANYEAAQRTGTVYEFLKDSLKDFQSANILTAGTLENKVSVIQESFNRISETIGQAMLPVLKSLADSGINTFFDEVQAGDRTFLQFKSNISDTAKQIGQNLGVALEQLKPLIQPLIELTLKFGEAIIKTVALLTKEVGRIATDILESFGLNANDVFNGVSKALEVFSNKVGFVIKSLGGLTKVAIGSFELLLAGSVKALRKLDNIVSKSIEAIINSLLEPINSVIKRINQVFNKDITQIKVDFPDIPIPDELNRQIERSKGLVSKGAKQLGDNFKNIFNDSVEDKLNILSPVDTAIDPGNSRGKGLPGNDNSESTKEQQKNQEKLASSRQRLKDAQEALQTSTQNAELQQVLNGYKREAAELETEILGITDKGLKKTKEIELFNIKNLDPLSAQLALQKEVVATRQKEFDFAQSSLLKSQQQGANESILNGLRVKALETETSLTEAKSKQDALESQINTTLEDRKQLVLGLDEKTKKASEKLSNELQELSNAATSVGKSLGDSISKAVETGEFDLKGLASTALSTFTGLLDNLAQQIISSGLSGIGGASSGGGAGLGSLFSGISSIFGGFFAEGGIAPGNKLSVVGERGPELIMPAGPTRVIPNHDLPNLLNGGGGTTVNFTVNAIDSKSFEQWLAHPGSQRMIAQTAIRSVQKESNRNLNRSPFE